MRKERLCEEKFEINAYRTGDISLIKLITVVIKLLQVYQRCCRIITGLLPSLLEYFRPICLIVVIKLFYAYYRHYWIFTGMLRLLSDYHMSISVVMELFQAYYHHY